MIDWAALNAVDWAVILVVAVSVGLSLWRGFTREAISLAGWVCAFIVANMFAAQLATFLAPWVDNITGRYMVAYVILFVLTLILAGLLARMGKQVVRASGLSLLDRGLGTVFGFARGVIIILVVTYVVRQLVPPENLNWLHQSQLMPQVDMLAQWVQVVFADLTQDLGPGLRP